MEERYDETAAGRVDVYRYIRPAPGSQGVEYAADLGDGFELPGECGAEDGHHRDGVLVDGLAYLLGGDDVTTLFHRKVLGFDIEIAAELFPYHLNIAAENQIGPGGVGITPPRTPAPFQRQTGQHDGLARPDRRHTGRAGRVLGVQTGRVKEIGDHVHASLLDRCRRRVFVLVDHVLVERLGHQFFGLWIHPRGDERREVEAG